MRHRICCKKIICLIVILILLLQPVVAESATGNISGRIVSSSSSSSSSNSESSSSGSSGSGGGGGGGGPPLFNSTFSNAFVTSKYIYEENEEIPLKLADVYTDATDIVNVSIVVDSPLYIDFRFANVIKLPGIEMPENAYRVYEFVFTKFGTRTKVEPKNAIVTFRVANNWIEAEKAGDVRLFEYLNNSWVEHPTELLGVNGSFTYFKSSFNHSGFYYLGYPEVRENKTRGMETNVNETQNISSSSNLPATNTSTTTSTNSINTSSSNSTSYPQQNVNQGALQESLIGNIMNDILNFLANLIQVIKSLFGI